MQTFVGWMHTSIKSLQSQMRYVITHTHVYINHLLMNYVSSICFTFIHGCGCGHTCLSTTTCNAATRTKPRPKLEKKRKEKEKKVTTNNNNSLVMTNI